jgi:RNA polymerase sigma-70 factor (ECF subfamily)
VTGAEQLPAPTKPKAPLTDLELVDAILRKDRKATADFVSRYADAVYGYLRARTFPRQERAEDLFQEVFVAAWEHLSHFRGDSSLESWLLGIARHKVEDYYRAQVREADPLGEADSVVGVEGEFELIAELDQAQQQAKMKTVLGALPEIYSLVLMWRYWEKRSTREMAALCGKTEKSIERLLARARQQFREEWTKA